MIGCCVKSDFDRCPIGLRETNSVDIILERPPFETEPCKLILIIVDATSGLDEEQRYQLLVRKLAAYASYAVSAELATAHPGVTPADVIIRVLTVHPPTLQMKLVTGVSTPDGRHRLRVFFDGYHAFMDRVRSMPSR